MELLIAIIFNFWGACDSRAADGLYKQAPPLIVLFTPFFSSSSAYERPRRRLYLADVRSSSFNFNNLKPAFAS